MYHLLIRSIDNHCIFYDLTAQYLTEGYYLTAKNSTVQSILNSASNQIKTNTPNEKTTYLLNDFKNYHLIIGILELITLIALLLLIIYLFKKDRNLKLAVFNRVILITLIVIFILFLLISIMITIANLGTFFNPNNAIISALSGDF